MINSTDNSAIKGQCGSLPRRRERGEGAVRAIKDREGLGYMKNYTVEGGEASEDFQKKKFLFSEERQNPKRALR